MSSCRPKCTFFCTRFGFFVEHRRRSPFFQVFPCSIHLLSTSNNGSIGFTPQTTWKMVSLSKDMFFVVDLGHLEPFVGIIFVTTGCKTSGSICSENARAWTPPDDHTTACATCACSAPSEKCSSRTLIHPLHTPLMIIRQHVQHLKDAKKSNPISTFRQASFLKFATLPRDRKWHI